MYKILSLGIVLIIVSSCSIGKKISQAQKSYEIGEYTRAAELYKKGYSRQKNRYLRGEYAFYMGQCYRLTNKPFKAVGAYLKALNMKYENKEVKLFLADSYLETGKIENAKKYYEQYLEDFPTDLRGQKGLSSCMMLMKKTDMKDYNIQKLKNVNSKYSDYCAAYIGVGYDNIIFSSMRTSKKRKRKSLITGQGTSALYFTKVDAKGNWSEPKLISENINNAKYDDGSPCVSADGKTMYFTRCRFNSEKPIGAEIYVSKRSGGEWGEAQPLKMGKDSLIVAHPAISPDGKTLYFVSDRPGGYGGKDIWASLQNDKGEWTEPYNLGSSVNTPGNEMFPYVRKDGTLYFSSDAHIGYGGLDIYKALKKDNKDWEVSNLGQPINSKSDDFGIIFQGKKNKGIFSSSRGSSKGVDNLFSFEIPELKFYLQGSVKDMQNNVLTNAYVRLIGSDGTMLKINIPKDGNFTVKLSPETDYVILVASKGYLNKKINFSTVGLSDDKIFNNNINMEKNNITEE